LFPPLIYVMNLSPLNNNTTKQQKQSMAENIMQAY